MGSSFFQFKQFRIEQNRSGMKVSADACMLGAYVQHSTASRILDIGTGTGLLSLMLAQRHTNAQIDAVEPEQHAFEQAVENVAASPWPDRVQLHHCAIQEFRPAKAYDLIISNPPFYPKHLPSANPQRRLAFHQDSLSFEELAKACAVLLAPEGNCSILLPVRQTEGFTFAAAEQGLYLQETLLLQHSAAHQPHRSISTYNFTKTKSPSTDRLLVRLEDDSYSPTYRQLLQPYYTIF